MYARHISGYFVVLARNCLACRLDYIVLNANEKRTNREKGLIPCQFLNTPREPRDRAEWKREIFTFHREKRSRKRLHGLTDFQNFWQVLFSTYHKQKIEAGASISSGPYFIPRKLDDVKFKICFFEVFVQEYTVRICNDLQLQRIHLFEYPIMQVS